MAITITKKKKKTTKLKTKNKVVEAAGVEQSALEYVRSVADEAGALEEQIKTKKQELKLIEAKFKKLVTPIQSMVDEEYNPTTAVHGSGKVFTCTISGKGNKTTLFDPMRALELFKDLGGDKLLTKVMNFSITDIKSHLTTSEQEEIIVTESVNARKLVFTKK